MSFYSINPYYLKQDLAPFKSISFLKMGKILWLGPMIQ